MPPFFFLLGVAPMVTLTNYFREMMFAAHWVRRNRATYMRDGMRDGMRNGIAREAA